MAGFVDKWRSWAKALRTEVFALYLANKDPRTPRHAKIIAACVVAYAFSPIDLIPDPILVLGYLDDILILPFGIALAIKLIPPAVMEDARRRAKEANTPGRVVSRAGAVLVIGIWLLVALLVTAWAWKFLRRGATVQGSRRQGNPAKSRRQVQTGRLPRSSWGISAQSDVEESG